MKTVVEKLEKEIKKIKTKDDSEEKKEQTTNRKISHTKKGQEC